MDHLQGLTEAKGRGSYGKAINAALDRYTDMQKATNAEILQRQEAYWNEQLRLNREWESKMMEDHRKHDGDLVASSNAALSNAVNKIVRAFTESRNRPATPQFLPIPFPLSPASTCDGSSFPFNNAGNVSSPPS